MANAQGWNQQEYLSALREMVRRVQTHVPFGEALFQMCNDAAFTCAAKVYATGFFDFPRIFSCSPTEYTAMEHTRDGVVCDRVVFQPRAAAMKRAVWENVRHETLGSPADSLRVLRASGLEPLLATQDVIRFQTPWTSRQEFEPYCRSTRAVVLEHEHTLATRSGVSNITREFVTQFRYPDTLCDWAGNAGHHLLYLPDCQRSVRLKLGPLELCVPYPRDLRTGRDFVQYVREGLATSQHKVLAESVFQYYDQFSLVVNGVRVSEAHDMTSFDRELSVIEILPERARRVRLAVPDDVVSHYLFLERKIKEYGGCGKDLCVREDASKIEDIAAAHVPYSLLHHTSDMRKVVERAAEQVAAFERKSVRDDVLRFEPLPSSATRFLDAGVRGLLSAGSVVASAAKSVVEELYAGGRN